MEIRKPEQKLERKSDLKALIEKLDAIEKKLDKLLKILSSKTAK